MQHHWAQAKDNPDRPYPHGVYSCAKLRKQPEDRAIKLLAAWEGRAGREAVSAVLDAERAFVLAAIRLHRDPHTPVAGPHDFSEVCLPPVLPVSDRVSVNSLAIFTLLHPKTITAMKSRVWGCTDGFANIHSNQH